MSTKLDNYDSNEIQIEHAPGVDESLYPKKNNERTVGPISYAFMWIGDGVNLGNMTLGASLVVAGIATLNIYQTFLAGIIAIAIISTIFALNDRLGYKTGIPYVAQLRMSFGIKGTIISSLLRGIPAIVWYGIQSWIGATALNEIAKIATDGSFDHVAICFVALVLLQIVLSLFGFHAIKWVESLASIIIMLALVYVFIILLTSHRDAIADTWVHTKGSWGLPFFGFIMVFLGNYAAIFLSAADYSRELKTGISNGKRGTLYFVSIFVAYGFVLTIGAMLASATGVTNPAKALAIIVDNSYITVFVSIFIVIGVIATNMVANIIPPAYVITLLTKLKYKPAAIITGLLALVAFPWELVKDSSAEGLNLFVLIYSAFLGPVVAILLVEYYILRKQKVDVAEIYKPDGQFAGFNPCALIAMFIGAAAAFIEVDLAWIVGAVVAAIAYILLMKFTFKNSKFKKGTIFEN
ncbi:NCS1 family transporter [Heyndrickxia oleronia]|jgi:NCS1 family nucleobase:cation symporter-1|uniref:NCS1 family transporter n=1 Tax=Heyndrickxia oleronia TaxID=38875 RepID=UPI00243185B3|nr:NCS1 family transporter [Heyndrickxia oleronia]MCI1590089.1 NCS1 family transporter [Heyndrickxia oleronia]MCI1613780.1 NCS1 family transporter [Heyndrickxia oleronia]MCI1744910.1 NCS1 family transporter [Heyndrickxia oleronia]MCI1761703.1 NCS1 family transporter [Heyndrickxia oleronia]